MRELFYKEFVEGLDEDELKIFKIQEMKFKGENYPLCENTLKDMFEQISNSECKNKSKFLALASMFFALLPIYGK